MDLQFGLAVVDRMNGDQACRQCMEGWMNRESKVDRLRTMGAKALLTLATRLSPKMVRPAGEIAAAPTL